MQVQTIFKDAFSESYAFITDKWRVPNKSIVTIFVFKDSKGKWNASKTISIYETLKRSTSKKVVEAKNVPTEILEIVNKVLKDDK